MKKFFFLLGIASLSLSACKKDSEPVPVADVRTSLLLAHDWKLAAQSVTYHRDGSNAVVQEVYSSIVPCAQDDVTKFNADKTIAYDEGATQCGKPGEMAPAEPGSWYFSNDQTTLYINEHQLHDATAAYQVLVLTEQTLQIRHVYTYRQNARDYTGTEDYTYTAL
ncbi:MAG: hypothetical protein EOO62_06560 [Hymenobacter sp.]|nr:MAG: hypothetical protein EOO62_06560 [Hymenobacter sp.]